MPTVAVVTGGTQGIGAAVARKLATVDTSVLVVYREGREGAMAISRQLGGMFAPFQCDVREDDAPRRIADAAERLGRPRVLVNNAGITGRISVLAEARDETIRSVIDVNLTSTIRLSREFVRRWGNEDATTDRAIVNVSSIAARTGAPFEYVWYAAAKAGINAFTIGLAREVAAQGIRVNAVNPGTTETGIHAKAGRPDRAALVGGRAPLGRPASVDEIAAAIVWMAGPESSYVTGSILDVAGGVR